MKRADARTDPQLKLRLQVDMKDKLVEVADRYSRPLSAEIIRRLAWTLNPVNGYDEGGELTHKPERVSERLTDADYLSIAERVAEILKNGEI